MATFKQYSQTLNDASEAFSIDSFTSDEIKVRVDGVLKSAGTHYNITSYTTSGGTVTWTGGNVPAENAVIRIYRITNTSSAKATYAAGSSVKAGDLNNNQTQLLRAIDEENDQLIQSWDVQDGAVTLAKLAANSVDSDQYVDGSIDLAHMSANSVDSNQYVDGSIDLIHLSANSVDSSKIVDDSIVNADIKSDAAISGSKLQASTGSNAGTMSAAHFTKLEGIEASATADQTNAEIRAAVEAASDSNVFTDADHSKLNAIEASATADQTNAEIRAAVEAATDSNVFTDVDHSKLNAIEASADVTDTANVTTAGAVMKTTVDAKGDLLVASANDTVTKLAAGTNNYILTADSSEATGLKWAAAGAGGDANQNAFSNIAVSGQTTVAADTTTDTLTIVGGTNVTVTTDASADSVTIAASGGEVTVQDEGSSLSTAATTLNFVGAGVTASGTGATKTITISGSGGGAVTTDFQYLELKALDNVNGAFSAGSAGYELVTKGTTTAVDPGEAAALFIVIAGVIQEPNTGTSIGSNDGFCVDGSSIFFGANLTAHPDYILWLKGSGSHTIDDDSIVEAKLDIHADPAGTNKFLGYTSNGMEWAVPPDTNTQLTEEQVEDFVGGMVTGNTETGITVTYEDSDGTLDFVVAPEGTSVVSTGESGGTKFLREDGDGTCSWQAVPAGTPTTTRGDIIYRGASADERLAKGSAGQVLKMGANDPEWGAASVGTITALNNQAANRLTTIGSTTTELDGEANLTFDGTDLTVAAGGAVVSSIYENPNTLTANHTIGTNNNAMVAGPFSVGSATLTIPSGSVFTVI